MADSERVLGTEITTVLSVIRRSEEDATVSVDADSTPTAEIRRLGLLVSEITADSVTHSDTGTYSFTWTPAYVGIYVITWSFSVGGEDYEEVEKLRVVAEVEGTSSSALEEDAASDMPAIGEEHVCLVTGAFYDAGGNPITGVFVRFTPERETTSFTSAGIIALEITAESDTDGSFRFYVVRGITGMLTVTGLGIVRQVTIPNTGTIPIQRLVETGDDLLEVQVPQFKKIPRRA